MVAVFLFKDNNMSYKANNSNYFKLSDAIWSIILGMIYNLKTPVGSL